MVLGHLFGNGSGEIWLHNLHCNGNESSLADCPRENSTWGKTNCHHGEDVSISCGGKCIKTESFCRVGFRRFSCKRAVKLEC